MIYAVECSVQREKKDCDFALFCLKMQYEVSELIKKAVLRTKTQTKQIKNAIY
jgi:hypothetical protein